MNKKTINNLLLCILLIVSILTVYYQVFFFDFINYDTPEYVYENSHVRKGITLNNIVWAFSTTACSNWHPLTWLSHMVDVELLGLNAGAHHAMNVLFHILNSLLLYWIIKKLSGSLWRSWFIASLFALHPLHIQSVAWVAERKDVLSTLFGFLSIISYCYYAQNKERSYYLLVILFFILSLLAKPMLVTLPFILLLIDYWILSCCNPPFSPILQQTIRTQLKEIADIFIEKIPLILLSTASSIITIYVQNKGGAMIAISEISFYSRLFNSINSYAQYILLTISPFNLAVIYPYPKEIHLYKSLLIGICLISISSFILFNIRNKVWLFVGWFFFLGTLVPVIGIVQVGLQAMADRYTYIPLIGLFIIIAGSINEAINYYQNKIGLNKCDLKKIFRLPISLSIILFFAIISWNQLQYWQNTITLFSRTIEITQDNYIAHNNLGVAFLDKNEYEKADKNFLNAIKATPNFAEAHLNYGFSLAQQNRISEAISHYNIAIKIKPDYQEVYINLGNIYYRDGKYFDALKQYLSAYKWNSSNVRALNGIGAVMFKQGEVKRGVYFIEKAFKINPNDPDTIHNLKKILTAIQSQQNK